jgi:LDH2 family malate/lactate/ureidoglycolate dehydrogenase
MKDESADRIRLDAATARVLAHQSLMGMGYDDDQAVILADHMMDAALCGYEYSGLPKILNLVEYRARHPGAGAMRVERESPVSILLDGGGNNGMLTINEATDQVIARAGAQGFAVAAIKNTWMSGRSAYYVEKIARAGLVGIHTASSLPQVAPPGGARAALGTNPIAFGFPTENEPLVIDVGTAAVMFTDLYLRVRRNEQIPAGVAIDSEGRPTRDPVEAMAGAALPFGGYKGFALALAMHAMGALSGSGSVGPGYLVLAIRPDLMIPLDQYRRDLSASIARVKATPRQPGVDAIRIPSERAFHERAVNLKNGIEIDRHVYDALQALAAQATPPAATRG